MTFDPFPKVQVIKKYIITLDQFAQLGRYAQNETQNKLDQV